MSEPGDNPEAEDEFCPDCYMRWSDCICERDYGIANDEFEYDPDIDSEDVIS